MKKVEEIKLDLVKGIEVSIVQKDGTKKTKFLSSKVLKERINSVMYQSLSIAIGRDAQQMLEESAFKNVPDEPLYNDVKKGLIKFDNNGNLKWHVYIVGNYFYIENKKYTFKSEEEAKIKFDFAKEYHRYLKRKQNGK